MVISNQLKQGDVIYVSLDSALGYETRKTRPCIVVSNNYFNHHYNKVWTMPISSSKKYLTQKRYTESPMFITFHKQRTNRNDRGHQYIFGTIMVQHLRSIDPRKRCYKGAIANLKNKIPLIRLCIQMSI